MEQINHIVEKTRERLSRIAREERGGGRTGRFKAVAAAAPRVSRGEILPRRAGGAVIR